MIHNPQQLVKELFALKIIGIVVLEFVLYCDSPFTLVTMGYIISSVVFASSMVSIQII